MKTQPEKGSFIAKKRQKTGEQAEKIAANMHSICEIRGVALVSKVDSSLRPTKTGYVHSKKSTVDCLGILYSGAGVAVEIKSCTTKKFRTEQLMGHQRKILATFDKFGGLGVVLIIVSPIEAYALLWPEFEAFLKCERRIIDLEKPFAELWRINPASPLPYLQLVEKRADENRLYIETISGKTRQKTGKKPA